MIKEVSVGYWLERQIQNDDALRYARLLAYLALWRLFDTPADIAKAMTKAHEQLIQDKSHEVVVLLNEFYLSFIEDFNTEIEVNNQVIYERLMQMVNSDSLPSYDLEYCRLLALGALKDLKQTERNVLNELSISHSQYRRTLEYSEKLAADLLYSDLISRNGFEYLPSTANTQINDFKPITQNPTILPIAIDIDAEKTSPALAQKAASIEERVIQKVFKGMQLEGKVYSEWHGVPKEFTTETFKKRQKTSQFVKLIDTLSDEQFLLMLDAMFDENVLVAIKCYVNTPANLVQHYSMLERLQQIQAKAQCSDIK